MRQKEICTVVFALTLALAPCIQAQKDPGPRGGAPGAGGFYPTLNASEQAFFNSAAGVFAEVDSVLGTLPGEEGRGLGPMFNANSCATCHAEPALGGSSPGMNSALHPIPNPQLAEATLDGAKNVVPSFITTNGPVREVRFVHNSNGTPHGGVHDLYTITGRSDAPGCTLAQPDFATQLSKNNAIFRIPTPTFGLGLVEFTTDASLRANLAQFPNLKQLLGIGGSLNSSGNDGTITRFGWKAQNKSLLMFAGEAYNVEQGVTNEIFPNERSEVSGCLFNSTPEDLTHFVINGSPVGTVGDFSADLISFSAFMRMTSPPQPAPMTQSAQNGSSLFTLVGCVLCHSGSLTTGKAPYTGMSNVTYHPYSDFALHHMGTKLADGLTQGAAGPDQFRTAPLWGLGQRLFFLHDGRTADLTQAIQAHSSSGSEANAVIKLFNSLNASQQQDVLNFLRSL
jgi:CxxC motif-containing protein (DUF1111 family)